MRDNRGARGAEEEGGHHTQPGRKYNMEDLWFCFHFIIVHFGEFSYTDLTFYLQSKRRERYVILATDGDTGMEIPSCHQSRKRIPINSQ